MAVTKSASNHHKIADLVNQEGNSLVDNDMQFTDRKFCVTNRQNPIRTVPTERTVRTEFKLSKNIRAKQRNILSVDNDI